MVEQFLSLQCMSRQHPLRCVVQSGHVINAEALIKQYDPTTIDESTKIPDIEWNTDVLRDSVVMLAGHHRVTAAVQAWPKMSAHKRTLQDRVDELDEELGKADHASEKSVEIEEEIKAINADIRRYRACMDLVQRWPVEVYQEGK
jgi:hypothetical protein